MSEKERGNLLLTGASGFLGGEIFKACSQQYRILTLGRSEGNNVQADLANQVPSLPAEFTKVIHAAGKAHIVPRTDAEKKAFFQVNYQGTVNLLDALQSSIQTLKQFIFISTVSVYGVEEGVAIDEAYPLLSNSPYGISKKKAEQEILEWCRKHGIHCLILRLPLIVGAGAPGNLGKLVNAVKKGRYLRIGGNEARKSAVLAKDVAKVAVRSSEVDGIYNLTDGVHPRFSELESAVARGLNRKIPLTLPLWLVRVLARVGDVTGKIGIELPVNSRRLRKMTTDLTFSDAKARRELNWEPGPVLAFLSGEK